MDIAILLIFALVYLGMILGEIPGLALDRGWRYGLSLALTVLITA